MKTRTTVLIAVVATALATSLICSPFMVAPGASKHSVTGCDNQILEMERYGSVQIFYRTSEWRHEEHKEWLATFESGQRDLTLKIEQFASTYCTSVDELYYRVMEHPMKPLNEE